MGDRVPHASSRPAYLPVLHQVASHPLVGDDFTGRIFVYAQDTSAQNMHELNNLLKDRKVPLGSNEDADEAGKFSREYCIGMSLTNCIVGEIEVRPGDIIFARDANGFGKPEDDAVQVWVTGGTGP